jgi:hypothetical protein
MLAAAAVVLTSAACVGPARTDDAYRGKAASMADDVRSSVETAIVGVEGARRHHLQTNYLSVLLGESEEDASANQDTFASVQPPSAASDDVRSETLDVTGNAVDVLSELRIRVRRGEGAELADTLPHLRRMARQLDRLATKLRG